MLISLLVIGGLVLTVVLFVTLQYYLSLNGGKVGAFFVPGVFAFFLIYFALNLNFLPFDKLISLTTQVRLAFIIVSVLGIAASMGIYFYARSRREARQRSRQVAERRKNRNRQAPHGSRKSL